jgi:hypothetical protein
MRCEECLTLVEGFFEGTLDEQDARQVGAHVASCPSCSLVLEELEQEQSFYLSYWREANVASPKWGAVLAGIESERDAPSVASPRNLFKRGFPAFAWARFNPALVAALVFVCAGVSLLFFISQKSLSPKPEIAVVNGDSSSSTARPARSEEGTAIVTTTPVDGGAATQDETRSPAREEERAEVEASLESARRNASQTVRRARNGAEDSSRELSFPQATHTHATVNSNPLPRVETSTSAPVSSELVRFEQALSLSRRLAAERPLAPVVRSPGMSADVAQHLERTQLLLLSLKNAQPAETGRAIDLVYEKGLSRRLLTRNVLLRREAESKSNLPLEELLDSIEPVLVEVANLPEQAASSDVISIGERIRRKGLVALLQAYRNEPVMVAARESF